MANYQITAPDGTKYQVTAPDDATQEQVMAYVQSQHAPKAAPLGSEQNPTQAQQQPEGSAFKGAIQGAYNVARQAALTPISGLTQIAGLIGGVDPGEISNEVMRTGEWNSPKMKQQGANEAVQQTAQKVIGAIPNLLNQGAEALTKFTPSNTGYSPGGNGMLSNLAPNMQLSPSQAQNAQSEANLKLGADLAGNILPMALGIRGKPTVADAIQPKITPFAKANSMGFTIRPSDATQLGKGGKATVGPALEGLAGDPQVAAEASVKNQPRTNELILQDLQKAAPGIQFPPDAALTPEMFDLARKPNEAVYQQVSKLGNITADSQYAKDILSLKGTSDKSFTKSQGKGINADIQELKDIYSEPQFDAADALEHIKDLRANARNNYAAASNPSIKNSASLTKLAQAQEQVANALINQIDRWAESRPEGFEKTGLGQQFRDARKNLAVINTLEDSVLPGTTDSSAGYFAKQANKGKPLSGNAQQIAEIYNNFPHSMKDASKIPNKTPFRRLDTAFGAGGAAIDAMTGKGKMAARAGGLILAAPISRGLLLSDLYQKGMLPKPPVPSPLATQLGPATGIGALLAGQLSPDDYTRLLLTGGK